MTAAGKARRHWTARERDAVLAHYGPLSREPWPAARIAAALGCGPRRVHRLAQRLGLRCRDREPVDYRAVLRHYRRGLCDRKVAFCAGCGIVAVWRWRRANGLPPNAGSWGHKTRGAS
jgi:hypothetical protein